MSHNFSSTDYRVSTVSPTTPSKAAIVPLFPAQPPANGAHPPHGLNDAAQPLERAGIGHNSGNAVDPGPATDFADNGPLALRTDISPKALGAFREALCSQGNEDVRQSAITNAMHRARAHADLPHLAYRILEQVASRCRWAYRYCCESNEMVAYFAGLAVANNLARISAAAVQVGRPRQHRGSAQSRWPADDVLHRGLYQWRPIEADPS